MELREKPINSPPSLSLAQEKCLKKQLLNLAIQQEVDAVFFNQQDVHDTIFLKFVYGKVLDFPLWSQRIDARDKCQELLYSLPIILKHSQKATKRDPRNKSTRQVVAKCFDMALRTKQEREHDRREQEQDITSRLQDQDRVVNCGAKLSVAAQTIMDCYDYRAIFCLIRAHSSISSLPVSFQRFNTILVHALAVWIDAELQDPNMLKKLKTIHMVTPTLAIRAVLAISNPVKLLQNVLSLLLARPFGSWNLMQKLFAVMVELSKTEKLVKEARRKLDKQLDAQSIDTGLRKKLHSKVQHYVRHVLATIPRRDAEDDDDGDGDSDGDNVVGPSATEPNDWQRLSPHAAVATLLAATSVSPSIGEKQQQQLLIDQETVTQTYEYVLLVARQQEKVDFIELLGNEQMRTILHELLPVIYTPMARLFSRARVSTHFYTLFKTLKRIIKATTLPTGGPKRYVPIMARFTSELYSFLHESAANDDHSVEDALAWLVSLLAFAQEKTIDLVPLLETLDSTTYGLLLKELDQVVAFYDYRAALKELACEKEDEGDEATSSNDTESHLSPPTTTFPEVLRPQLTYIPLLTKSFVSMIKPQLNSKETTPQYTATSEDSKASSPQTHSQLDSSHILPTSSHSLLDASLSTDLPCTATRPQL